MATEPAAARVTPHLRRDRQMEMYRRALERLPGGTDSNFRAWGDSTVYVDRGKGGMVWDADGNEYVDLRLGYGPVILGHGDARVDDYVNERMRQGVSFSLTSEDEIRTVELINELTGNPTPIALAPARDWDHSGQRYGDPSKSRRELGFEAEMPLREGLERTIAWYRAQAPLHAAH